MLKPSQLLSRSTIICNMRPSLYTRARSGAVGQQQCSMCPAGPCISRSRKSLTCYRPGKPHQRAVQSSAKRPTMEEPAIQAHFNLAPFDVSKDQEYIRLPLDCTEVHPWSLDMQ